MLQSKMGTFTGTASDAFNSIVNFGNSVDGFNGQRVSIQNLFYTITGESGSGAATKVVSLIAKSAGVDVTLQANSVDAEATVNNSFTSEVAMCRGPQSVSNIGFKILAKSGDTPVTVKYLINYE